MGELLDRVFRINVEQRSRTEVEAVAEGAVAMQEQHARDLLSLAQTARRVRRSDPRLERARTVLDRLR
jgi:hypothetical protein